MTSPDIYAGLSAKPSKYLTTYILLVEKRIEFPLHKEEYGERHHIVPKSFGGGNDKTNLVRFSAREHFIAHRLLERMYRNDASNTALWMKMANAIWKMTNAENRHQERHKVNSRTFETLKRVKAKANRAANTGLKFYTNGSENKKFIPGTEPKGWWLEGPTKGALLGKRRYTNGNCARLFLEGEQPPGWVLEGNNLGKTWFTDGVSYKRLAAGNQPDGWWESGTCVGMLWFTDGTENKKFFPGEEPIGWLPGGPNRGKKYYTDGISVKRFVPGSQPIGWSTTQLKSYSVYTNGVETIRCLSNEKPDGWVSANPTRNSKWYTNGTENIRRSEGSQPSGWLPGVTRKSKT